MTLSIDYKGWHIWSNTQGRIICNGPDAENRLFEFANYDNAVNWFYMIDRKEIARLINAAKPKE